VFLTLTLLCRCNFVNSHQLSHGTLPLMLRRSGLQLLSSAQRSVPPLCLVLLQSRGRSIQTYSLLRNSVAELVKNLVAARTLISLSVKSSVLLHDR